MIMSGFHQPSPVLIGLAADNLLNHPDPVSHLVYGSADGPMRAAVRVEKIPQNKNNT